MNVLHITAFALRGGCEKNCYHFCHGANDHHHDILVLDGPGPMTAAWESLGINVVHLHLVDQNIFTFARSLKKFLQKRKYDLAVLWSTIRLPLQLNSLNDVAQNIRVYLGNPLTKAYNAKKDRALGLIFPFKASVKLMACSAYVAASHENDHYFGKFPIAVSLNPVALPAAFPVKTIDALHFNIGMVARLDPIKDHKTVLNAFKRIKSDIPNAQLHLVGDGSMREELQALAIKLDISSSTFFYGDVGDVYHHLNQWHVFVYATTPNEGLGSVVAEAMANGLPCVLSDLPMLRELAPSPDLALWFEAGSSGGLAVNVTNLYHHDDTRSQLAVAAYNYALEHFGVQRFITDYLKIE